MKIHSKVQILEEKTKEAERTAELAEADAREKDKELVEALKRLKDYESVSIFILSVRELKIIPDTKRVLWLLCVPCRKHSISLDFKLFKLQSICFISRELFPNLFFFF